MPAGGASEEAAGASDGAGDGARESPTAHSDRAEDQVFTVPVPARGSRRSAAAQPAPAAPSPSGNGGAAPAPMPPPSGPPLATASPAGGPRPTPGYAPWSTPAPSVAAPAPAAPVAAVTAGPGQASPSAREEPSDAVSLWNLGLVLLGLTVGYWFFAGIRFLSYLVEVGVTDRIVDETIDMVSVETVAAAVVSVLAAVCLGLSRQKRDRPGGGGAFVWSIGLAVLTVLTAVWRLV